MLPDVFYQWKENRVLEYVPKEDIPPEEYEEDEDLPAQEDDEEEEQGEEK